MPAPQDPLASLMSQMATGMGPLDQNMKSMAQMPIKLLSDGLEFANTLAPHNVLANLAKGAGTFSAVLPTSEINRMNIFG
jgi:hypothetical protein